MKHKPNFRVIVFAALLAAGLLLGNCGRKGPEDPPDTTPPSIIATSPIDQAREVPADSAISVTFSEPVSANTVTFSLVQLGNPGRFVPVSMSCNGATAVFTIPDGMNLGAQHEAKVKAGVKDVAGNILVAEYTWYFITSSTQTTSTTHTVTASAGPGGRIAPASAQVPNGGTTSFSATPDAGFVIDSVTGCSGSLSGNTYTTGAVTGPCQVQASFRAATEPPPPPTEHTVTARVAGGNGWIDPAARQVENGKTTFFTVGADSGYQIDSVTGCGGSLSGTRYTTGAITGPCEVIASFRPAPVSTYTIKAKADSTGEIIPSGDVIVRDGESIQFEIKTDGVFVISSVEVDGDQVDIPRFAQNFFYTFVNVSRDHQISAKFRRVWQIEASATSLGSINPSGIIAVEEGSSPLFEMVPGPGSSITGVYVDGVPVSTGARYQFEPVTSNHTIYATFAQIAPVQHTVTAPTAENGSITPGLALVPDGQQYQFTVSANEGYHIASVTGCGGTLLDGTYTTGPVTADCVVEASFAADDPVLYSITTILGENGLISPSSVTVESGATASFTVTANAGYLIDTVDGCGGSITGGDAGIATYTTGVISGDCIVTAAFKQEVPSEAVTLQSVKSPQIKHPKLVLVSAVQQPMLYRITAIHGDNGSISPDSAIVAHGGMMPFTITPRLPDFHFDIPLGGTCTGILKGNVFTAGPVVEDCTIEVTFSRNIAI